MPRCDCGAAIIHTDETEFMCTACHAEYWAKFCEECGADPEQPCASGCTNQNKNPDTPFK